MEQWSMVVIYLSFFTFHFDCRGLIPLALCVCVCVCVCVFHCYVSLGNLTLLAVWMPGRGTVCDSHKYRRAAPSDPQTFKCSWFVPRFIEGGRPVPSTHFNHCIYSFLAVIFHLKALSRVLTAHNESNANLRLALEVWRWWSGIIILWFQELKWLCTLHRL